MHPGQWLPSARCRGDSTPGSVQPWHGAADTAVPPAFGHWLAGRIGGAEAHFPAEDDHGSIHDNHLAEAYEWLRYHI